jgi:site-specific recombinase XerD
MALRFPASLGTSLITTLVIAYRTKVVTNKTQRDLIKEFLAYIQVEKGLARHTLESYGRDLKRLDRWAATSGTPIEDLTRPDLRKWIAQLSRDGLAPPSVARAVSAARGFYRFLMLDGHRKHQPTEDLDTPQRFAYLPKFLTEEEIDRLFAAPDISTLEGIRDRALFELMYAAGLRVSEVISLKETDIELHAGLVKAHGKGWERARSIGCNGTPRSRRVMVARLRLFCFCMPAGRYPGSSPGRRSSAMRSRRD